MRPRSRELFALALAVTIAGCVLPPTRSSLGGAATGLGGGYRVSVGAHSSAADAADTANAAPVDLGAGWVSEGGGDRDAVHGTYLSLGRRVRLGGRNALWISGRAEMFWRIDRGQPRDGVSARVALRRHLADVRWGESDRDGAVGVLGAVATGLYADVGVRELEGGGSESFVSVGVEIDLPLVAAFAKPLLF